MMKKTKNNKSNTTEAKVGRKRNVGRRMEKNPIQKVAAKINAPERLKAVERNVKKIDPNNVAKGAAVVSVTAGVVAVGAAMLDRENRQKAGKMAEKGMEFIQEIADDAGNKYQAVAQSIPIKRRSSKKQNTKR